MINIAELSKYLSILGVQAGATPAQISYVKKYAGAASDTAALLAADTALSPGGVLVLEVGKTYSIDTPLTLSNAGHIVGNNATIKPTLNCLKSGAAQVVQWGKQIAFYAGFAPFTLSANTKSFSLPANVTLAPGDLIWLRGKNNGNSGYSAADAYVASPVSPGTASDYFNGMFAVVQEVSGGTVRISTPAYADFAVYGIIRYQGLPMMKMENVNFDFSAFDITCSSYIEGLAIYGTNIEIEGCRFSGNEYAIDGAALYGENATVQNSQFKRFLNVQGLGANGTGGRAGYGLLSNANNAEVLKNVFDDCKHSYSSGGHYAVARNATIRKNLVFEDATLNYTLADGSAKMFEGSIDFHCGVTGRQNVMENFIVGVERLIALRNKNGGIRIEKNTMVTLSTAASGTIISGYEVGFDGVKVNDNDIYFASGSGMAVMSVTGTYGGGDYIDAIKNIRITNNRLVGYGASPGGYALLVTRPTLTMEKVFADSNTCTNIKAVASIVAGSAGTPAALISKGLSVCGNTLDACEQLVFVNLETAAANQLANWKILDNVFINAVAPTPHVISLATPNNNGRTAQINNLSVEHNTVDMTSAAVKDGAGYCLNIGISISQGSISNNTLLRNGGGSGSFRNTILQTASFTDVMVADNVLDTDLTVASQFISTPTYLQNVSFETNNMRSLAINEGSTADVRLNNVTITGNTLSGIQYAPRSGSTAWGGNNSNDVAVNGNVLRGSSGYSVDISANAIGHRLRFFNNGMARGFSDASGTYYGKPVGNYTINSNASQSVAITSIVTGASTTFNVPNMNGTGINHPFLRVGDQVIITGTSGTSSALLNGIPLVVTAVTSSSFTVAVTTSSTLTGGVYALVPAIWWKGGVTVQADGNMTATAAPTSGSWTLGDTVINQSPASAGFIGWVCTAGGTPGTWKTFGAIS